MSDSKYNDLIWRSPVHMSWNNSRAWKIYDDTIQPFLEDKQFYPRQQDIFNALGVPFDDVRVVIIGQDPYHTAGVANGLAFSTHPHVKPLPPSLRNIFAEYSEDLGFTTPSTGNLNPWKERGVLLLNRILTVEPGKALSHANIGWETFTYTLVRELSTKRDGIVWMLWGKKAQEIQAAIDNESHLILTAAHPSPLVPTGFLGCKHFSKACDHMGVSKDFWRL